jgi:hypothetical protein
MTGLFHMSLSGNAKLYPVLACDIDVVWEGVVPYLEKTLTHADGKFLVSDIYDAIKERDMQLWVVFDKYLLCFVITQIIYFPQGKRLAIPFVGGTQINKWIHLYPQLIEFGRANGCTHAEGYAREGWLKVLKKFGFKKIYSVISAPI